jgi:cell division protein FtsN
VATITAVDAAVVPPATARPAASGSYIVQVGSYPNDAAAASAWQSIKGKNTTLLATYKPDVVKADLGPKGTWYRLRVGPFDSKESASDLCNKLQANGQACLVAKP